MSSSHRLNSTRTPQQHSDFIGNLLELPRYQHGGDLAAERNPYQAFGEGLGAGQEFADPSSTTFELTLTSDAIDVSQLVLPAVSIYFAAEGDDRWIFDYSLIFTFVDETGQVIRGASRPSGTGCEASSSTRRTAIITGSCRRRSARRPRWTGR